MPLWSSESRVRRIIAKVSAYEGFRPLGLTLDEFLGKWVPDLERDNVRVGVNWSGSRAVGYDYTVAEARQRLEWEVAHRVSGGSTPPTPVN
jgi:hypothetical protein